MWQKANLYVPDETMREWARPEAAGVGSGQRIQLCLDEHVVRCHVRKDEAHLLTTVGSVFIPLVLCPLRLICGTMPGTRTPLHFRMLAKSDIASRQERREHMPGDRLSRKNITCLRLRCPALNTSMQPAVTH